MITIRLAVAEDAEGIAAALLESAQHHARLDPARYQVPAAETLSARYRQGPQRLPDTGAAGITLVAEAAGEVIGFIEARCEQSPDPMHRNIVFCHVAEIAVSSRHRSRGIGGRLLRAVEDWGRLEGATFASLEYHVANTRAGAFYEQKMGYGAAAVTAIKRL